jgi:ornithine cyclodeaminase/alanine dehydrogenase-like protein (mu-crystallin family)
MTHEALLESEPAIVTERELRGLVPLDAAAIAAVERAFIWSAQGRVQSPPVMHIGITEHNGDVDIKSAYIKGETHFAVKIAAGFYDNSRHALPTGSGLVVLIDSRTGRPAMVFIDNGYLTDVRTAAAGAVAVKHLARSVDTRIGIIGCGAQARYQLRAIAALGKLTAVYVAARSNEKAQQYAREMSAELALPITVVSTAMLAEASDLIVTTTPATTPILHGDQLHAGQTIIAMGSDAPNKRELDGRVFERAALVVCDKRSQCESIGEVHHGLQLAADRATPRIVELGEVATGAVPGRTADDEIIVCDLTGMGAQDSAIGLFARERVLKDGG